MTAQTTSPHPHRGLITAERASAMGRRAGAVRRVRRDRRKADELEARAGVLLGRAAALRLQAAQTLAAEGLTDA